MKTLFVIALTLIFHFSYNVLANEELGWFKRKIKDRIIRNQNTKPPPQVSTIEKEITKPGNYTLTLKMDEADRYFKVHIPESYNKNIPTPLIIALHGGGGDMETQSQEEYYHLISKSNKEGFLIAFPNGYSQFTSGKFATWNAGNCCGEAREKKIDDVLFIKEVVKKISQLVNVAQNNIFAIGMSNGGMMAYRLACEASEIFKAIASVAGTDNTTYCHSKKTISILHIHAKNDDHVLYQGGAGKPFFDRSKVTEFTSVPATTNKWIKKMKCPKQPQKVLKNAGAYCDSYSPCDGDREFKVCITQDGGHSWPGGKTPRGTNKNSTALDANQEIWDFFKKQLI